MVRSRVDFCNRGVFDQRGFLSGSHRPARVGDRRNPDLLTRDREKPARHGALGIDCRRSTCFGKHPIVSRVGGCRAGIGAFDLASVPQGGRLNDHWQALQHDRSSRICFWHAMEKVAPLFHPRGGARHHALASAGSSRTSLPFVLGPLTGRSKRAERYRTVSSKARA